MTFLSECDRFQEIGALLLVLDKWAFGAPHELQGAELLAAELDGDRVASVLERPELLVAER